MSVLLLTMKKCVRISQPWRELGADVASFWSLFFSEVFSFLLIHCCNVFVCRTLIHELLKKLDSYLWSQRSGCLAPKVQTSLSVTRINQSERFLKTKDSDLFLTSTNNIEEYEQYLKCSYRQNFYFLIRSYISSNEPWRKKFSIWIKSDLFMSL